MMAETTMSMEEPSVCSIGSVGSLASPKPQTPRRLQVVLPPFNRSLSMDPSVCGSRRSSRSSQSVLSSPLTEPANPSDFKQGLRSPSVYLKFLQLMLTTMCLGLLMDGYELVDHSVSAIHFPFIVYSAYTIITVVIIIGYVCGMKMRELLIRVFGTLGGILFLISGCHTANIAAVYWQDWQGRYEEGQPDYDVDDVDTFDVSTIPRRRILFVVQMALAFVAAAVFFVDVAISFRRTMELLN